MIVSNDNYKDKKYHIQETHRANIEGWKSEYEFVEEHNPDLKQQKKHHQPRTKI